MTLAPLPSLAVLFHSQHDQGNVGAIRGCGAAGGVRIGVFIGNYGEARCQCVQWVF